MPSKGVDDEPGKAQNQRRRRPRVPNPNDGKRFEFVNISQPEDARARETRRVVRSKAARGPAVSTAEDQQLTSFALAPLASEGDEFETEARSSMGGGGGMTSIPPPSRRLGLVPACQCQPEQNRQQQLSTGPDGSDGDSWTAMAFPLSMGMYGILSAARRDPFASTARALAPFEDFLFDHFMTDVVMNAYPCREHDMYTENIRREISAVWGRAGVADPGMMASLLLASSRDLALHRDGTKDIFDFVASNYRGECLRLLGEDLASYTSAVTDVTVTRTLALATDAAHTGDAAAAKKHFVAASWMLNVMGGSTSLHIGGKYGKLLIWFLDDPKNQRNTIFEAKCLIGLVQSSDPSLQMKDLNR